MNHLGGTFSRPLHQTTNRALIHVYPMEDYSYTHYYILDHEEIGVYATDVSLIEIGEADAPNM